MKKDLVYVVEVAEYDFRNETEQSRDERFDLEENGVNSYENFRIKGIYDTEEDAEKRFANLSRERVTEWEKQGLFADMSDYDLTRKKEYDGTPIPMNPNNDNDIEGYWDEDPNEWGIYVNTPTEYWICRCDNDIEFRIRIRKCKKDEL